MFAVVSSIFRTIGVHKSRPTLASLHQDTAEAAEAQRGRVVGTDKAKTPPVYKLAAPGLSSREKNILRDSKAAAVSKSRGA